MNHVRIFIFMLVGVSLALVGGASAQNPPLPVIPTNTFNVVEHGAVGDGTTINTAAIQKTIDAASAAGAGPC